MVIKSTSEFKGLLSSYPDGWFSQWLIHQKVTAGILFGMLPLSTAVKTAGKDLEILDMVPDFQKFIISLGK